MFLIFSGEISKISSSLLTLISRLVEASLTQTDIPMQSVCAMNSTRMRRICSISKQRSCSRHSPPSSRSYQRPGCFSNAHLPSFSNPGFASGYVSDKLPYDSPFLTVPNFAEYRPLYCFLYKLSNSTEQSDLGRPLFLPI